MELRKRYGDDNSNMSKIDFRMEEIKIGKLFSATIHDMIVKLDGWTDDKLRENAQKLVKQSEKEYTPWSKLAETLKEHQAIMDEISNFNRPKRPEPTPDEASRSYDQMPSSMSQEDAEAAERLHASLERQATAIHDIPNMRKFKVCRMTDPPKGIYKSLKDSIGHGLELI